MKNIDPIPQKVEQIPIKEPVPIPQDLIHETLINKIQRLEIIILEQMNIVDRANVKQATFC